MSQELDELCREAGQQGYGPAQNALLEQVVARADSEGEEDIAFAYRLHLSDAYGQSGEPRLAFAPFARCLADLDADPGRFGSYRHRVLWGFKGIVHAMTYFPEVSLEQTRSMLAEMERRYLDAGHGLHAVHQHRWMVAAHVGDREAAEEHFRAWVTSPRDAMSDCAGCDPDAQVQHLHWVGRDDEAVSLGLDALSRPLGCREQPHHLQTELLGSLVAQGRLDEARDAHQRGYRAMRTLVGELPGLAKHLRFATATGNLDRASEIFARHRHQLVTRPQPLADMEFRAVASRLLHAVDEVEPGTVVLDEHDAATPAAELAQRYADEARVIAAQFDERNQTSYQGRRVEDLLTEERWVDHLPLLALPGRTAPTATTTTTPVPAAPSPEHDGGEASADDAREPDASPAQPAPEPDLPDPEDVEVGALLDLAEDALAVPDADVARRAVERFDAGRPEAERSEAEQGRLWVARAALVDLDGRDQDGWAEREADALRSGLVHLAVAGDEVRLQRTRAHLGILLAQQGALQEAAATADGALAWLVEHDDPDRRPGWVYRRVLLDRAVGQTEAAYEGLRALFAEPSGTVDRDEHVALSLAQEELARGRFAEAAGAASRALTSRDPRRWRWARRFRADALRGLGDAGAAVEQRLEALAGTATVPHAADDPVLVLELAEDHLAAGSTSDGVEAGEVALALARRGDDPRPLEGAWLLLLRGYKALGEPALALEQVLALSDVLVDDPEPGFLGGLLEEKGELLFRLDRHGEAVTTFVGSAEAYARAGRTTAQVRALRWAVEAATREGSPERAAALWQEAHAAGETLPDEDQEGWFHRGWLWVERGQAEGRAGRTSEATTALERAEAVFHHAGMPDQATEASLVRMELVGSDVDEVRAVFVGAQPRSRVWYRSGWLLADRLRGADRDAEADALEDELEDE